VFPFQTLPLGQERHFPLWKKYPGLQETLVTVTVYLLLI
jgi:hypothetical protein